MNQAFLEDLKKEAGLDSSMPLQWPEDVYKLQLYSAMKLWSIEQILLQNQEQR